MFGEATKYHTAIADNVSTDPLLYDRLIRQYQSPLEKEQDARSRGLASLLEADMLRAEARQESLQTLAGSASGTAQPVAQQTYIQHVLPKGKEDASDEWRTIMRQRFLDGQDPSFDYGSVDNNAEYDDALQEQRDREDAYFDSQEAEWYVPQDTQLQGQTGVQDF